MYQFNDLILLSFMKFNIVKKWRF